VAEAATRAGILPQSTPWFNRQTQPAAGFANTHKRLWPAGCNARGQRCITPVANDAEKQRSIGQAGRVKQVLPREPGYHFGRGGFAECTVFSHQLPTLIRTDGVQTTVLEQLPIPL
jgi:hypothetical protein